MGRPFVEWLGDGHLYGCATCRVPLAKKDALVSKAFHARSGKAYLFNHAANFCTGKVSCIDVAICQQDDEGCDGIRWTQVLKRRE